MTWGVPSVFGWERASWRTWGGASNDGVHPGVARSLGRLVVLSEGRTPSHPDAAELRPCHPDRVTPTALRERCRSHKELCLEVLAVGHEVGHKDKHLRRRWR